MRRKNLNAPEGIERKKVRIASYDAGSLSAHREFKKLVVLRITASCYACVDIDPLSLTSKSRKKNSNVFLADIPAELLSAEDFVEFGEDCKGK